MGETRLTLSTNFCPMDKETVLSLILLSKKTRGVGDKPVSLKTKAKTRII